MKLLLLLFMLPILGVSPEDLVLPVDSYFPDTPIMIKFIGLQPETEYGLMVGDRWYHNFTAESTEYSMVANFKWRWMEDDGKTFILTFWRLDPLALLDIETLERPQEGFPIHFGISIGIILLSVGLIFGVPISIYNWKKRKNERV